MVIILTEFRQIAAFDGSSVNIRCTIDKMEKQHRACWMLDANALTWGDDVSEEYQQEVQQTVERDGDTTAYSLDMELDIKKHNWKTLSMQVYEKRANGTLYLVTDKCISQFEIKPKMERVFMRCLHRRRIPSMRQPHDVPSPIERRKLVFQGSTRELQATIVSSELGIEINWCLDGKVITRGDEVLDDSRKQRLVVSLNTYTLCGPENVNFIKTKLIIKDAKEMDTGVYSVKSSHSGRLEVANLKIL